MTDQEKKPLTLISTGISGLDQVLDGGLPDKSFNLIAGGPGTGKTTLAHQIIFFNATPERPALYFTVLGEPPLKMLRYQQQLTFFDINKVGNAIRFVNLSRETLEHDLGKVLSIIVKEVETSKAGIVVVDSFRTIVRSSTTTLAGEMHLHAFLQRLAMFLTSWNATSFLVGEYAENEMQNNPIFTIADGLFWLYQTADRNSIVRKLQTMKMRGHSTMPGFHTFRISNAGIQVFPRIPGRIQGPSVLPHLKRRISTGNVELDAMVGGGIPAGDSVLIAGPSGSGKSILASQFIAEGAKHQEPGVLAVFEEHPLEYVSRAKSLGYDIEEMARSGHVKLIYLRPLDLSVDETQQEIWDAIATIGAKRVVIDSLSGFEMALAPTFREDFRESIYRMMGTLTRGGVTLLMTVEVTETYSELRFSPHEISFLADDILLQRYFEMNGELRRVLVVVKMRNSQHSTDFRAYDITSHGLKIGESLRELRGILTGVPEMQWERRLLFVGLTDLEANVLQTLMDLGEADMNKIAIQTGLNSEEIEIALSRLVSLNYAVRGTREGTFTFRSVARSLGQERYWKTKGAA